MPAATNGSVGADSGLGSNGAAVTSALTERTVNLRLPPALRRRAVQGSGNRLGRFLRAIDRRLLPPVGRALTRLGRGALWGRVVATTGAVACVAITVVAVYTATRPSTVAPPPQAGIQVGVSSGDFIPGYKTTKAASLAQAVKEQGQSGDTTMRYALVSFARSLTPAQLVPLLAGTEAAEVFLRAPAAGVVEAPVRVIPGDVVKAMDAHARDLAVDVGDLDTMIRGMTSQSSDVARLKNVYVDRRAAEELEQNAYAEACDCVFGAVVHGSLNALSALSDRPGARVVDLIPLIPDVSRDTFMPAIPEQLGFASPPPVEATGPH